jgi:hypothetical protein
MGMREDLNAAMDATSEEDESQNFEETAQEVLLDGTETDTTETEQNVEEGDQATGEPETTANKPDADIKAETADTSGAAPEAEGETPHGDSIKAPVDWGPKDREAWSSIPRHLQEKVAAREKELNTVLQSTVEARRTHQEFSHLATQYGSVLSGMAGSPLEAAGMMFKTAANLRMGTPIQKAQIIADMISDFGIDINTLDSAIVGEAPPAHQQESARIDQLVAERMAPFEQMMGQQNAYANQQKQQSQDSANNEVADFAKNAEFLADVRMDMADLIDMASKRGYNMPMQEAYEKACSFKPEIQSVLDERKKRSDLLSSNNSIANKRIAASSVNGQQIGNGGGNGALSMRDTIAAAWDGQGKV